MLLADKLSYVKKQLHLTSEEIATRSGIPLSTMNKICAGQTRSPAPGTLLQISKAIGTPICYLLDDTVPMEHSKAARSEHCGSLFLTSQELYLLHQYRSLTPDTQRAFCTVADDISDLPQPAISALPSRQLICYIPMKPGERGFSSDTFLRKFIQVAADSISKHADFALQLTNHAVEPVYPAGAVLLCKKCEVKHNQLGFFLLNREPHVRNLYTTKEKTKLVPVNIELRSITVYPEDNFRCMGAILGPARLCHSPS